MFHFDQLLEIIIKSQEINISLAFKKHHHFYLLIYNHFKILMIY